MDCRGYRLTMTIVVSKFLIIVTKVLQAKKTSRLVLEVFFSYLSYILTLNCHTLWSIFSFFPEINKHTAEENTRVCTNYNTNHHC